MPAVGYQTTRITRRPQTIGIPRFPLLRKNAENTRGLFLESFRGPWYGRSEVMAAKCP